MKKLILLLFVFSTIYSCKTTRRYEPLNAVMVKPRNSKTKLYKVKKDNATKKNNKKIKVDVFTLDNDLMAQVKKKDSFLVVYPIDETFKFKKEDTTLIIIDSVNYPKNSFFYPLMDFRQGTYDSIKFKYRLCKNIDLLRSDKFKYRARKMVLQTLNFPMKIRLGGGDEITGYTPFSAVNLSIAAGLKIDTYKYRNYNLAKDGRFLNNNINEHSFSAGIFAGPTLIELDSTNTGGEIPTERKSVGLTTGCFIVVAVQKFNIGAGFGIDIAIGNEESSWKYSAWPPWVGLAIGLSFIK
jgi:hypothetical protein